MVSSKREIVTVALYEDTRWHVYPCTPESYGTHEIEVKPYEHLGDAIVRVFPKFGYVLPCASVLARRPAVPGDVPLRTLS